jgi:hypothetical protein
MTRRAFKQAVAALTNTTEDSDIVRDITLLADERMDELREELINVIKNQ